MTPTPRISVSTLYLRISTPFPRDIVNKPRLYFFFFIIGAMSLISILPIVHSYSLKRIEVEDFITILANERPAREISEAKTSQSSSLLAVPGEVRNTIYEYCLEVGIDRVPRPINACHSLARNDAFNLLQTCRQIHAEARSLLEHTVVAYIPMQGVIGVGLAADMFNRSGIISLASVQITALQALTSFWNVHFHLHTTGISVPNTFTRGWAKRIAFDREICSLYSRLRQAILVFTAASPKIVRGRPHHKRHAIVHFDHYFTVWNKRIIQHQHMFTLFHLISLMGRDTSTTWEIRYYENTEWDDWTDNPIQYRLDTWNQIVKLCKPYKHITPRMEIYGAELPEGEGIYETTRTITPSSVHWPCWPEHVPWRKQSDKKVLALGP